MIFSRYEQSEISVESSHFKHTAFVCLYSRVSVQKVAQAKLGILEITQEQ